MENNKEKSYVSVFVTHQKYSTIMEGVKDKREVVLSSHFGNLFPQQIYQLPEILSSNASLERIKLSFSVEISSISSQTATDEDKSSDMLPIARPFSNILPWAHMGHFIWQAADASTSRWQG